MRTLYMAIGLAALVGVVSASLAQAPRGSDRGKSARTGTEADHRKTRDELSDGPGSETEEYSGVFLAVPIGKVSVGPEFVGGGPVFARRTTATKGITVVEISTTPFMADLPGVEISIDGQAELPAPW
jgi:hypothetical protein